MQCGRSSRDSQGNNLQIATTVESTTQRKRHDTTNYNTQKHDFATKTRHNACHGKATDTRQPKLQHGRTYRTTQFTTRLKDTQYQMPWHTKRYARTEVTAQQQTYTTTKVTARPRIRHNACYGTAKLEETTV